jgi:hypothetical protein
VVLVLQRLEREKDTRTALRAWQLSRLADDGWTLRIVGSGSERTSLEAWAASERLGGVTFENWTPRVTDEYADAGIFLAPAPAEPFGLTVVEAMAAGVPVVACSAGGHLETIGMLRGSAMFSPGNAEECAALLRAFLSESARASASRAGRRLVEASFTVGRHVDQLLHEYDAAARVRHRRADPKAGNVKRTGSCKAEPSPRVRVSLPSEAGDALSIPASARAIAFYLPQFHPIAENDEWWGKGFTEWTNVARARRLFRGHMQPHLPRDLGFYDLRVPEVRQAQADLAARYGVAGFCYWHYWFAGRRILERPFDEVLASGEPSLPFCLGWANQTWSGIWHGAPNRILVEQTYPGPRDDEAHFEQLLPAFSDPRYLTVDRKPLFYVYRPEQLPNASAWVERWRTLAERAGLPGLYLVAEVSDLLGRGPKYASVETDGWDAGAYMRFPAVQTTLSVLKMRLRRKLRGGPEVYPYASEPERLSENLAGLLPAVHPNWDNTPRAGREGVVLHQATPQAFCQHVREAVNRVAHRPPAERLLFIKSWNEWAEGNYLEPDIEYGHEWLLALRYGLWPEPGPGETDPIQNFRPAIEPHSL